MAYQQQGNNNNNQHRANGFGSNGNRQNGNSNNVYGNGCNRREGDVQGNGGAQGAQEDAWTIRTKFVETMKKYFAENDIAEGKTVLEDKMAPGDVFDLKEKFDTNAYGVSLAPFAVYLYHLEMKAKKRGDADDKWSIDITKSSESEYVAVNRAARCRAIFEYLKSNCTTQFPVTSKYFYDLSSVLMTTEKLSDQDIVFEIQPSQNASTLFNRFSRIQVTVKMAKQQDQLISNDLSMAQSNDLASFDRSHQRFIELAISRHALFSPNDYVCFNGGKLYFFYPNQVFNNGKLIDSMNHFSADKYLGLGVKKSAKYVEGPKGRGALNVAVFISPMMTPFYRRQTILEFLEGRRQIDARSRNIDFRAVERAIKDLYIVNPCLSKAKSFKLVGLSQETASTHFFEKDGQRVSVKQYFSERYEIQLKFPDLPLVRGKGDFQLLPMEIAMIEDNQPISNNKLSQKETADMVKIAAQPPSIQKQLVDGAMKALKLDELKKDVDGMQLTKSLPVEGRLLKKPEIVYGNNKIVTPKPDALWGNVGPKTFYRCGSSQKWALLRDGGRPCDLNRFQQCFVDGCKKFGIKIPNNPYFVEMVNDRTPYSYWFKQASEAGVDFILVVSDKEIHMQAELKMNERQYEICTQNVTSKVAGDVIKGGSVTLEGIISKTNVKLGGTNYSLSHQADHVNNCFGKDCLIIGIALSHAGAVDEVQKQRGGTTTETAPLSSIAYAANTGKDPWEFIGDYIPSPSYRSEIVELIPGIISACMSKFVENRGRPSCLLMYMNGSSEGDFAILKRFEVPLIKAKIVDIVGKELPLTVIVPQKNNIARIYKKNPNPNDRPTKQNIAPGVCIDTALVHPRVNEFYLNSHIAIQGTARTPKYTILHNDNEAGTMNAFEHITFFLAFCHQIITSPTSLPTPVTVASAYAERATKLLKGFRESGINPDPEEIVSEWTYGESKFKHVRINA